MDDEKIIALFRQRDESAIAETEKMYSSLCGRIIMNILSDRSDTDETLNDTWLRAWDTIPPEHPKSLGAYLTVIARNLALDKYRRRSASKRGEAFSSVLDEAAELLPDTVRVEELIEQRVFIERVNRFLSTLPKRKRVLFVRRYFCLDSIAEIASRYGLKESYITVTLMRVRNKLRAYLEKEELI